MELLEYLYDRLESKDLGNMLEDGLTCGNLEIVQ